MSGYFRVLGTCCVHRAEQKGGGRRGTGSSLRLEPDNTGIAQAPRKSDSETRAGGRGESRFQVTEQVLWAQEYNHETRGVNLQPANSSIRADRLSSHPSEHARPCSEQRKRDVWAPRLRPAHRVKCGSRGSGSTQQPLSNVLASLKLMTPTRV